MSENSATLCSFLSKLSSNISFNKILTTCLVRFFTLITLLVFNGSNKFVKVKLIVSTTSCVTFLQLIVYKVNFNVIIVAFECSMF